MQIGQGNAEWKIGNAKWKVEGKWGKREIENGSWELGERLTDCLTEFW